MMSIGLIIVFLFILCVAALTSAWALYRTGQVRHSDAALSIGWGLAIAFCLALAGTSSKFFAMAGVVVAVLLISVAGVALTKKESRYV